jgi:AcrR family transcriptional regulator
MAGPSAASRRKLPKQARARATVEAVLQATAQVLVESGYEETTTNRVARVAGVSVGSLYQYFPNKESLVAALLERHEEHMLAQLTEMTQQLEGASLEDAIRTYVRAMLAVHAEHPELHRVLTQQLPNIYDTERYQYVQRRIESVVRGYFERHRHRLRPASLEQATFILSTAVESVTHAAVLDRPEMLEDDTFAEEISQLVLCYLLSERASSSPG